MVGNDDKVNQEEFCDQSIEISSGNNSYLILLLYYRKNFLKIFKIVLKFVSKGAINV
jgi:hypothetical protein